MTKSLLTRLYHRIVAKRIEALCPCSEQQKAFRRGDEIAENLFLCGPAYPRSHSAEDAEAEGASLGKESVTHGAFADDQFIASDTITGLEKNVERLVSAL